MMDYPHWDDVDWNWGFEERDEGEPDESSANEWYDRQLEERAMQGEVA